jgi:hypothetical protein
LNSLEIQEVSELLVVIPRKTRKTPKTIILPFRKPSKLFYNLPALSITSPHITKLFQKLF